ncbi:MAG: endonuclease III domain-containing protein [Elusimicrobia bacterium]|nr:endonuclease III domain-containing protein [Elusimicrobiota bacterium]
MESFYHKRRTLRKLRRRYRSLRQFLGPQNWWPSVPPRSRGLRPLYHRLRGENGEAIGERQKLEVCVGAILTQNTAWRNAERALENLHRSGPLSIARISRMPPARLARLLRPSGYFNCKARRLKIFARYVRKRYGGRVGRLLDSKPWPALREELLGLSGVGPETADSMLLYAGGFPVFVVDAYTRRILARWGDLDRKESEDYERVQDYFLRHLPKNAGLFNEYHALLVGLGKDYCRKKPLCGRCPVRRDCRFFLG